MSSGNELNLTDQEQWIVEETLRTGNLDIFTNAFMRLPLSGTTWSPLGGMGHYRSWFSYQQLHEAWRAAGRPEEKFTIVADDLAVGLNLIWDANDPSFLYPHGYLFLDWIKPIIAPEMDIALAETGTGTGKTSGLAIAMLTYCVLYPGFKARNLAPTDHQSNLMVEEIVKWITGSPFTKFVKKTRGDELYTKKPHAKVEIISPFSPKHTSTLECQTIGLNANNILGTNADMQTLDEVQLMLGISDALPKILTRSRGQRSSGVKRWHKLILLTNPGDNPEVGQLKEKIRHIQLDPKSKIKAAVYEDIDSRVNVYITPDQMDFQEALMDAQDKARWHGGSDEGIGLQRLFPDRLLDACKSEWLDDQLRQEGKYDAVKRDGLDIIKYQIPYEPGHYYMVVGDPGQTPAFKLTYNNVPVVLAFDVTEFLVKPSRLVYFHMIDGDGSYEPWIEAFKNAMTTYQCAGYYDATDSKGAMNDIHGFDGFAAIPISFAGNEKRWARTCLQLLMQDGMFEFPYLMALWYQAGIYRETGPGVEKLADDIMAAFMVYCLGCKYEGTLWSRLSQRYHWAHQAMQGKQTAPSGPKIGSRNRRNVRRGRR